MATTSDTWILGQLETNGDYSEAIRAEMAENDRRERSEFGDGRGTRLRQYCGFNVEYVSQKNEMTEVRVSDSKRRLIGSRIAEKLVFDGRPEKLYDEVLWAAEFVKINNANE